MQITERDAGNGLISVVCAHTLVADSSGVLLKTTLGKEFSDPLFQRALLDVHMMVVHNGAERTVVEWCAAAQ